MTSNYDLPPPSADALLISQQLSAHIAKRLIQQNAPLSFAEFMELALYHPEWGYYQTPQIKLGAQGDFMTAPEISPLFAHCFAQQCRQLPDPLTRQILELGAGSGRFAADFLIRLAQQDTLPDHYYILEISPALKARQQAHLRLHCPALLSRVTWLDQLPFEFSGVILANEVLDALPAHRMRLHHDTIEEGCVNWINDAFEWVYCKPTSPVLTHQFSALCQQYHLKDTYVSEIHLRQQEMVQSLATCLSRGILFLIDYGYGEREYYHPERSEGTLTCFYQHHRHANPFLYPGLQDITTHVNFTRVIETAARHGCTLEGFTTQSAFLLASGLLSLAREAESHLLAADAFKLHQAIKRLTMPMEMGEVVKVMALGKNIETFKELKLTGFEGTDRSRDL